MKKILILVLAIGYCLSPDLFAGPVDDAVVMLGSMAFTALTSKDRRDPTYMKMDRDF